LIGKASIAELIISANNKNTIEQIKPTQMLKVLLINKLTGHNKAQSSNSCRNADSYLKQALNHKIYPI
jgi:hypothetical protein